MLTPLFQAVGLPAEAIGLVLAVDAIPDLFATVLNVTGDMAATTFVQRLVLEPSTPALHSASL
jgi:Na+/H+-dicarboxylate symporter